MTQHAFQTQLTPNFRLGEFLKPDSDIPPPWILDNLTCLANRLQVVRDLLGRPIRITSGYRTPEQNQAVGGVPNSEHLSGRAADIVIPGFSAKALQNFLKNWSGGMGLYPHFTHVDIRPQKARWR